MDTYTYEKICEDINAGGTHKVANEETHMLGEITMCNHGYFNVHVGHGEEVWPSGKCHEVTPENEWKYRKDHKG